MGEEKVAAVCHSQSLCRIHQTNNTEPSQQTKLSGDQERNIHKNMCTQPHNEK